MIIGRRSLVDFVSTVHPISQMFLSDGHDDYSIIYFECYLRLVRRFGASWEQKVPWSLPQKKADSRWRAYEPLRSSRKTVETEKKGRSKRFEHQGLVLGTWEYFVRLACLAGDVMVMSLGWKVYPTTYDLKCDR